MRLLRKKFNTFMSDFENNIVLFSPKGWLRDTPEELILKALENKNRYFFEMEKELADNEIFPDHHPNKVGAEHIAGDVFEYLVKNKLIACK